MEAQREKWNTRYRAQEISPSPCSVLTQHAALLPHRGLALDLACGLGGNAIFLAQRGLDCDAWDIADVAIEKLASRSHNENLNINTTCRDVSSGNIPENHYDVVIVSYFLDRSLLHKLAQSLKPGGLIYYQTFNQLQAAGQRRGPSSPDYLLKANELNQVFSEFHVLFHNEMHNVESDLSRSETLFVARKPAEQ